MWRTVALILAACNVALAKDSPIDKVVTLLTELRDEIMTEGEKEAKTYDEFACFCKDGMAEKSQEISDGENSKTTLESDLGTAQTNRDAEDKNIADKTQALADVQGEIEALTKTRHDELLAFETNEVDLTGAVQGLEAAIRAMKAAQTATSFAQVAPALKKAAAAAKAVGVNTASAQKVVALVKSKQSPFPDGFAPPSEDYTFQGGDIISTLEGLLTDFKATKTQLQADESSARQAYDLEVQTKEGQITTYEGELEQHKKDKAAAVVAAATASQDLSQTAAELLSDQQYLAQLSEKCHEKAVMWDRRTQARADEIAALTQALAIIQSEDVQGNSTLAQVRQAVTKGAAPGLVARPVRLHSFGRRWARLPKPPMAAVAVSKQLSAATLSRMTRITSLLKAKATSLNSKFLGLMADRVSKDPFEKVKVMIQELIERLLKEAAEEANHKGWCDKEVSAATTKRDSAAEVIRELNGKLEAGEVRIEKLTELIADLEGEVTEMTSTLSNATDLRDQEKTENEKAVQDAEKGRDAVRQAITVLQMYYGEAKNKAEALIQQPTTGDNVDEDVPDSGFDGAYAGKQDAKDGVIGMLEVIESDFQRAADDARAAEKEQAQEFLELEKEIGMSNASKTVAIQERTTSLGEANATDTTDRESLRSKLTQLNNALSEMEALQEACFGGGQSAEERKVQREEEIAALNQALCILDSKDGGASC